MISTAITTRFAQKRILVIDDEHRLAESLAALLRGVGYQVQAATSGIAGLDLVYRETFDLVITDLRMDKVDGFDIMRYVAEKCPQTAIIVITGHASTESVIEALHQRVADYIPKPFDFDLLRGAIERVFSQQETERLKKDMVNMLTHDIKIPLTSVLGFAELLLNPRGDSAANSPQYAEKIVVNCQRVLAMLDNYLTNARAEDGRLEVVPVPVVLQDLIGEALHLASLEFKKKRITVQVSFPEEALNIEADEPLLTRAVANLLNNAAKYTPEEGHVLLTAARLDGEFLIEVSNTGDTLPSEDVQAIFDRYQRARSSKGIDGTGLGLHIVKCVAEAHGGTASCRSADGVTSFRVVLPLSLPTVDA